MTQIKQWVISRYMWRRVTGEGVQRLHHLGDRTRHFHNLSDLATDALCPDEAAAATTARRGARTRYVLPDTSVAGSNVAMLQVCCCSHGHCILAVLAVKDAEMLLVVPVLRAACPAVPHAARHASACTGTTRSGPPPGRTFLCYMKTSVDCRLLKVLT